MKLNHILDGISYELIQGSDSIDIIQIAWDSRNVKPDSLFICVKGKNIDRHIFAEDASAKGAIALIVEQDILIDNKNITIIKVKNTKAAMAIIASNFYKEPSKKFNLIGITGTNGKTSTSYFIAKIFENAKHKYGIISTIENKIGNLTLETEKLNPTTPDAIELQASFKEMADNNVTDVVMEVTSIALDNHRVDKCDFNVGVFTNLTQDHLDEHGTMENYKKAKMKLFRMCKKGIINIDDKASKDIIEYSSCEVLTYGINNTADFMAKDISYSLDGVKFTLQFRNDTRNVELMIPGKFSVYNALAAIGACYAIGISLDDIVKGLSLIKGVRGRFQTVPNTKGYMVVVDYAHSPDSLENILNSVRELKANKVVTVFGCGGDRDKTKRAIMGEIAGKLSDYCIITSDNPRSENPLSIINDIEKGIVNSSCPYEKVVNRRLAILTALNCASPSDIVVIAGKGHETYQIVADEVKHFNDVEVVQELLTQLK